MITIASHNPTALPHFWLIVLSLLMFSFFEINDLKLPALVIVWYFDQGLRLFGKSDVRYFWYISSLYCIFARTSFIIPCFMIICQTIAHERTKDTLRFLESSILNVCYYLKDIAIPYARPWMGDNSLPFIQPYLDDLQTAYENFLIEMQWTITSTAEFLRSEGVSTAPLDMRDHSPMGADTALLTYQKYSKMAKTSAMFLTTVALVLMLGPVGICVTIVTYLATLTETDDTYTKIDETSKGMKFPSGTYRIRNSLLGFILETGIGVGYNGILHIPYHVCRGLPINYGKGVIKPYYVSICEDICTYGGPPQFTTPDTTGEIYVNCETDQSRTTYRVDVDVSDNASLLSWPGLTKPGESGSPVYMIRGEKMYLLALAGRYIKDINSNTTEFARTTICEDSDIEDFDQNVKQVITHPGSGKTRVMIPNIIMHDLPSMKGKTILITGPTRVVCREMYGSLKSKFKVGLNIKGQKHERDPLAYVQIAAHRTALRMLLTGDRILRNLGMIMIDEAHVDDPATMLLRQYARHLSERGVKIVELSATLDEKSDNGSNFTIQDKEIKQDDIIPSIQDALDNEKRVMVFVPSFSDRNTQQIMKHFKTYEPVELSRRNFENATTAVADVNRRLILSTDIAECGINVPDLDVVIDTGLKYTYSEECGIISGRKIGLTQASIVQRRGRVGRSKPGSYLYVNVPRQAHVKTAAQVDSELLATGRNWAMKGGNPWNKMLTDKQFMTWLESDKPPLEIYLTTDYMGALKNTPDLRHDIQKWRNGKNGTYYKGCSNSCDKCQGHYEFYDERMHDTVFQVKTHVELT
nr:non-structural protein 2 [Wuhan aphid virus 1]